MKLCVIGSSHTGAIKEAQPMIEAALPDLSLDFFALPGGLFRRATLHDNMIRSGAETDQEIAITTQINGALTKDLSEFDHILVIGHRYDLTNVLHGWVRGDQDAQSQMQSKIAASIARIAYNYAPDDRLTFLSAPYPALRARAEGPKQEPAIRGILQHVDRDQIFADFETAIRDQMQNAGFRWLPQPSDTRAGPFVTQNRYLKGAMDFQTHQKINGDLRHMNADYGLALLTAYARDHLGLEVAQHDNQV